ncbi:YidC/Oxa1 family membrane protein insertase [Nocardioides sp. CPCC 205120]|uniref:YidC/Oxa1 family membrane protein insertase n=1 Tax=Nocardioides sp. CPCC 205120 TaxID=3406462 RepID=UPI003B506E05
MSVLDPLTHALAALVAATHATLTHLGAAPDGALAWCLALLAVVAAVRLLLLPLVVHGVRQAHASARARSDLAELARRYRGRRDAASLRAYADERRRVGAEHGVSRWGCLPVLVQLPVWVALLHLVSDTAAGASVGALDAGLVASLGAATIAGVPLADRGLAGGAPGHVAVVALLAGTAAVLSYVTQRFLVLPNLVLDGAPEAVVSAQRLMPALSALGLVAAAGVVPVALLVYWVGNATWTLGQSAVVARWFPTPGSPAAVRREARRSPA